MFKLTTSLTPAGDQPKSINKIIKNFNNGVKNQVLLGATGTGKTFVVANVISQLKLNTLIIVHNKTLAGQLYNEFKELFKEDSVEYFISYFDFFQPEAYIPRSDTYIEKNAQVNDEIEMLRLSTINSLANGKPVIVVASVAAIYASSSPEDFKKYRVIVKNGETCNIKNFLHKLINIQYQHNNIELKPGVFRQKGDIIEIMPGDSAQFIIRISLFGDTIEDISCIDALTNRIINKYNTYVFAPANEYVTDSEHIEQSLENIKNEMMQRIKYFKSNNKLLEAQRIEQRTKHDMDSLKEMGYCSGIENYASHLELRKPGTTPYTIFDYFDKDWLLVVDESHITIPQIRGMFNTDKSRKETLVEYGFRLPSAMDNRPLNFSEFESKIKYGLYISATPCEWEKQKSNNVIVEQIVRPTGLLDPTIVIKPSKNQVDDLINELIDQNKKNQRTFITVLTIKMAENLTEFLNSKGIKCAYMHSELKTLDRSVIINDLRKGKYDAIVGINLLREGLDVPEVSLVAIFDADKPGFFRNERSLIQIFGRAARNLNGRIIMYADTITKDMQSAINETDRRRKIQSDYNKKNNITPTTIIKSIHENISSNKEEKIIEQTFEYKKKILHEKNKSKAISILKKEMLLASNKQDYEKAMYLRDMIIDLESKIK